MNLFGVGTGTHAPAPVFNTMESLPLFFLSKRQKIKVKGKKCTVYNIPLFQTSPPVLTAVFLTLKPDTAGLEACITFIL